jgi:hypothetical protein
MKDEFSKNDSKSLDVVLGTILIAVVVLGVIVDAHVVRGSRFYEDRYLHSAITVEQDQRKGGFDINLIRVGNWIHPINLSWGPLVNDFRVDMSVTSISTRPSELWLSHFYLSDNIGGNYSWVRRNSLVLGVISPGETRAGFVLFPAPNPVASAITLVVTEIGSPDNIVYQFQVAI